MERPPKSLKLFCNRLARTVSSENGAEVTRLLRLAGLLAQSEAQERNSRFITTEDRQTAESSSTSPANLDRVGIWERRDAGGDYFVRCKDMAHDWGSWVNVGLIVPKAERRRIVLIGESVARGYFYDPEFTPAIVLEEILRSRSVNGQFEVIDLARTGLGLEVKELAISALLLKPDAVLIFAGNNWSIPSSPKSVDITWMETALHEQGIPGLKGFVESQLADKVRSLVSEIGVLYAARDVPLAWVIPEFNLGDWRDPLTNAPHLVDGTNQVWMELWHVAQNALQSGDLRRAQELAEQMVELDQGTCVAGLYLMADCAQRSGNLALAADCLERARDAVIWDISRDVSPRTYSIVRKTLREEAERFGHVIVDIKMIFESCLGGGLPGRKFFLDYCHLTTEGIRIAMAAAASCMLSSLTKVDVQWSELMNECVAPSRQVEAEAAFLAAIHNAHWGQSYEVVRYHCSRALALAPGLSRSMVLFLDLQTRHAPMLMCRATEHMVKLGSRQMLHYLLSQNRQQLDRILLEAIVDSLKEVGLEVRERLHKLRREEHSVACEERNLLDYYYCSAGLQAQELGWLRREVRRKGSDYYKAYWKYSLFTFVGESNCSVRLRLTCRLPNSGQPRMTVGIEVNGRQQEAIQVGRDWGTWEITVAGEVVRDGLNEFVVHWPIPEFPGERALAALLEDLMDDGVPEFFCVFGEVHSLTAAKSPF